MDTQGNGYDECILQLYDRGAQLIEERLVRSQFREIFSLSQKVSQYRVVVRCKGSLEKFASDEIVLGTRESYIDPIDLGVIELPRGG